MRKKSGLRRNEAGGGLRFGERGRVARGGIEKIGFEREALLPRLRELQARHLATLIGDAQRVRDGGSGRERGAMRCEDRLQGARGRGGGGNLRAQFVAQGR